MRKINDSVSKTSRGPLFFYSPGLMPYNVEDHQATTKLRFPGVSITGSRCDLLCDHCNASLLEKMIHVKTPEELELVGKKIIRAGGTGLLVSGGSRADGSIPLKPFLPALTQLKKMNLVVVLHTGLVDRRLASALSLSGVDAVLIDIIGDSSTISEVCHLKKMVSDYERSLRFLKATGIKLVPHIVLGLHYGKIQGEYKAVEVIASVGVDALVFVVLTPLKSTTMAQVTPVSPEEARGVIRYARQKMAGTPMILGCARPRGPYSWALEKACIEAGIRGIAFPSEQCVQFAKNRRYKIIWRDMCCSLLFQDLQTHNRQGVAAEHPFSV
ncbi:MAG: radical SAM protein [Candidatus Heimdallarchaeota archaeon]